MAAPEFSPEAVSLSALEALDRAHLLLDSPWGDPVGLTPSRVVYRRRSELPYCQGQCIQGRVKGESDPHVVLHLLSDHDFKRHFDHDIREIERTQTVVHRELWVQRQVRERGDRAPSPRRAVRQAKQEPESGACLFTRLILAPASPTEQGATSERATRVATRRRPSPGLPPGTPLLTSLCRARVRR